MKLHSMVAVWHAWKDCGEVLAAVGTWQDWEQVAGWKVVESEHLSQI